MFEYSGKTNLIQWRARDYILNDVSEPELYRDFFPYDEIPKVAFNHRIVPINMPDEIWITDTTFRDGQQSITPYTTEQIVKIFEYLHRLSGPKGIVRQSEFFLYSKKDRDAVYRCLEKGYEFPEVTSWIRASKKDFELVKELGMKESGILVSCSDYHIFLKMKMTRRQAIDHYIGIVRECIESGVRPRCHLEDITRADYYGFVVPFAIELMALSREAKIPIKIITGNWMTNIIKYVNIIFLPLKTTCNLFNLLHYRFLLLRNNKNGLCLLYIFLDCLFRLSKPVLIILLFQDRLRDCVPSLRNMRLYLFLTNQHIFSNSF